MGRNEDDWRAQFEELGVGTVRKLVLSYSGDIQKCAMSWLAQREREDREREADSKALEIAIAREAKDAALSANRLAREAADAAKTNNKIATAALIAAVIAIAISIIGMFVK